jgi:hypothetical protein
MPIRQTRVFVRSDELADNWAETLIGKIFQPLTTEFVDALIWFWFSRYVQSADDSGDCEISKIADEFKQPLSPSGGPVHRSLRLRFNIDDQLKCTAFEQRATELIGTGGYRITDFRDYDQVADTGSNRFLGVENRQSRRAEQRAKLTTSFYFSISKLVIDALVGPDEHGRFRMETNDDSRENPRGSTFQSLLHLFCNITQVPTDVYIYQKLGMSMIGFGTFMYPPPSPIGGWDQQVEAHPIRY